MTELTGRDREIYERGFRDGLEEARAERVRAVSEARRRRFAEDPAARQEAYLQKKARERQAQDESRTAATKHGQEWTGPELEIAADLSRSIPEVARLLGRSIAGVRSQRRKLAVDPRKARMAGLIS